MARRIRNNPARQRIISAEVCSAATPEYAFSPELDFPAAFLFMPAICDK
jgi:hypothetical protein